MSGGVMAEEDIEYESDPEETKMSLKMRRREASDDEEEDGREKPVRRVDDEFDGESEGAAAEYEDDLEEEDYYDLDEEYVEEEIEEPNYGERGSEMGGGSVLVVPVQAAGVDGDLGEEIVVKNGADTNAEIRVDGGGPEEEKKEIEPYAVPTAGAFYMHDDRFQDNTRGRNRRMLGGRKLWESKDNRKWGHDMFEELTTSERTYEERRGSRGGFRGRGRNRGTGPGYARGYRSHNYSNSSSQNNNNHNNAPKRMRGRGPRRYQPSLKNNNEGSPMPNKLSRKSVEKPSYVTSAKTNESASNAERDMILPRKQGFASSLSIASPPFYPSGSSTKHNAVQHKRDVQAGTSNQNSQQSANESFNVTQSSTMLKGKSIVDSIGVERLAIGDSLSATARKPSNNMHLPASSSISTNAAQPQMRGHGRGKTSSTKLTYQPTYSNNQVNGVPTPSQLQTVPRYPGQTPAQSSVQTPDQQFARVPSGSRASSPPSVAVLESSKPEYPSEYSKSTTASVATGTEKSNVQGRGSFLYSGAHVMGASGNRGAVHGDQNFSAFLPVMQFGGKHPRGMGVPAVGMAFPGYVGQPQLGLGNSEMTWLPVIAGAAGALGAQYRPPFISADGSYHTQPSEKVSTITAASSKENKAVSAELANDESGQRQKNPRRYTEMKFDQ